MLKKSWSIWTFQLIILGSKNLLKVIQSLAQFPNIRGILGMNKALGLVHKIILCQYTIKKCNVHVKLSYDPMIRDCKTQNNFDSARFHYKAESFKKVHSISLWNPLAPNSALEMLPIKLYLTLNTHLFATTLVAESAGTKV